MVFLLYREMRRKREEEEGGLFHLRHLEVGHLHSAAFVISDSPINHAGAGVNAQWLCSAGGLSLWMPGLQPQCSTVFSQLSFSSCPSVLWRGEITFLLWPLCVQISPLSFDVLLKFFQPPASDLLNEMLTFVPLSNSLKPQVHLPSSYCPTSHQRIVLILRYSARVTSPISQFPVQVLTCLGF